MIFKGNYNRQQNVPGEQGAVLLPQNSDAVGNKPIDVDKYYNISNPQNSSIAQPYAIPLVESISESTMFGSPSQAMQSRAISSADEESGAEYQSYGMSNASLESQAKVIQNTESSAVTGTLNSVAPKGFQEFVRTQLGRKVIIDFLIGNEIIPKTGYLLGVAKDYILISEDGSGDMTACDIKDVKFIKFV